MLHTKVTLVTGNRSIIKGQICSSQKHFSKVQHIYLTVLIIIGVMGMANSMADVWKGTLML